ncbi:MAG: hypothetical protein WED33_12980 [Bacteroidia bacterium]
MSPIRIKINKPEYGLLYRASLLFMLLLGIFSIVLSKERLYGDSADYLLRMIQESSFFIIHSRPASIFIEWLPVLLIKQGASLQLVVIAQSFSEWLWMFLNFIFLGFILKSPKHAIALVMVYLFSIRWNYFNPVSELLLAFPLFILLHYLWSTLHNRVLLTNLLLSWTIGLFLFFSHPLYIIALPVMLGFIWLQESKRRDYIFIGIGLLALVALRYYYLDSYEKDPLSTMNLSLTPEKMLKRFIAIGTFYELGKCYAGFIFLFIAGAFALKKTKSWLRFSLLIAFVLGFAGLVAHKFGGLYPETFEPFERYVFILPLTVVTVLIPVWSKWTGWKRNLLILFMSWHAFYMYRYSRIVVNRYEVFENAIQNSRQFDDAKVVYRKENYHPEFLSNRINGHDWIMTSESLILSSMKGKDSTKQVYIKELFPDDFYEKLSEDDFMYYISGWTMPVSSLNHDYMNMKPGKWRVANTDSAQHIDQEFIESIVFSPSEEAQFSVNEKTHLQIKLVNQTGQPLFSGMRIRKAGIGYKWLKKGETQLQKGKFLSPLMADLYSEVNQRIIVVGPETEGEYELIPGWHFEDNDEFYPFGEKMNVSVRN